LAVGRIPIIVGPTAVGKTAVALALSRLLPIEVVSADSRQVYRRLDIGTAKPTAKERARVTHHGIDQVDPGIRYSAGRFAKDAPGWIELIRTRNATPVVAGGTGLYIRALAEGLFIEPTSDPVQRVAVRAWTDTLDTRELVRWATRFDQGFQGGGRQRASRAIELVLLTGQPLSYWQAIARQEAAVDPWYVVLTVPRPILHQRIEQRAESMVARGLIEEVASVLSEGHSARAPGLDGIGIREAVEYLHGHRSRESVAPAIAVSTRQYAKRQETWFRHQLRGDILTLDAVRSPEQLAEEIATRWRHQQGTNSTP
jgi:tRNA dimethylallyltransferase